MADYNSSVLKRLDLKVDEKPINNGCNGTLKTNSTIHMESTNETKNNQVPRKSSCFVDVKLYKRRFFMLFLFALCFGMNGLPQFQYTVVADIVSCYYRVNLSYVNWCSMVYMVAFLCLVFPVCYLMDKIGLKITLVMGATFNCLGSWIQCASFTPDRYVLILICQTAYAIAQVCLLSLPPFVAGVWFGATEVSLACAFGVFGNLFGVALGFIIPPLLITNDCNNERDISFGFSMLAYPQAAINTVILIAIILVFENKPPIFPSIAQATKTSETIDYRKSLKSFFTYKPFIFLLLGFGLITGTYISIATLINEMVLIHFPGHEVDAGWMGTIMVFAGMLGSIFLGAVLDKTHKYKLVSVLVFLTSFLLLGAYTFLIKLEVIWIQYLLFTILGLMMTAFWTVGYDYGAEVTYPESQAMSASLLNASTMVFTIVIANIAAPLLQKYGDFSSNLLFCGCLFVGTIMMVCMKCELKRTNAGTISEDSQPC